MINKDETSAEHQKLLNNALARFNDVLKVKTEQEIRRLTSLLAVADFYTGGSKELLHEILWGEKYAHVSMEVKAVIANAHRHRRDDAVVWSYRYLEGKALELFIKSCELDVDMVPLVAANENVTGDAVNLFLDGYSSPETKIAYLEQLSIVNFTDKFMRIVWQKTLHRYDNRIKLILIEKFRTIWELDSTIPDSWVIHSLDQSVSNYAKQLFFERFVTQTKL